MAHAVENMFAVGQTPWHGLGEVLQEAPTISEAIGLAGLDWEVGLKELVTVDGEPVPNRATFRKDTGAILGVVGPRYQPLQNQEAFDWFQPFVDANECELHTAGSLCEGEKVWVLAKLNRENSEIVPGDEVAKFILLSNSHNGTTAIRVGYTPIRVVCANTMAAAHSSNASKLIRVRHTRSASANLENIRGVMDNINADFEATAEQFQFLASKQIHRGDLEKYVKVVLGVDKKAPEEIKTRTQNIIDNVLARFYSPKQQMPGVAGTWWGAYNAYNEYLNYEKGRNTNNRMDSLWFGTGVNDNSKALSVATDFANAV